MFPAGVPHRWWNGEHNPLETNDRLVSAADLDRFLQAIFAVANAETSGSMAVLCCILMHRHRRTQRLTAIAWAVRRMVLPAVGLAGWLLGKYRRDAWHCALSHAPLEAPT
jgi:hypothetical protein